MIAMSADRTRRAIAWGLLAAFALAGCAATPPFSVDVVDAKPGDYAALKAHRIDREVGDRLLALDPERVSASDVANVLSKAPAPRIMLVHGGVYPVHLAMSSFGEFLVGMGYPEKKIRDPGSALERIPGQRCLLLGNDCADSHGLSGRCRHRLIPAHARPQ